MTSLVPVPTSPPTSPPTSAPGSPGGGPQPTAAEQRRGRAAYDGVTPFRRTPPRLLLTCLLLLVSSVAWRKGTYFSGGMDAVVLGKAAMGVVALALAATAPRTGPAWSRLRVGPLPLLGVYLGVSTVGAALHGSGFPTLVLVARVALIAATVVFLVRAYPGRTVLSSLTCAMLVLAGFGSATGVGSLASEGRLYGGVPPLNANEIALLVSVPAVCLLWRCVNRVAGPADVLGIPVLLGVVWLTGTRTGLLALVVAVVIVVVMAPRVPVPLFSLGVLTVPVVLGVLFLTPLLTQYATRGDTASTMTLNSRTVAWSAALHYAHDPTERLVGVGLAVKQIPVSAMYRNEQILDSTWMSAIVQSGAVGTAVLGLLVLLTLLRAMAVPPPDRSLGLAVLVMLVLLSVLESGLFDASAAFIAFCAFALVSQRVDSPEGGAA